MTREYLKQVYNYLSSNHITFGTILESSDNLRYSMYSMTVSMVNTKVSFSLRLYEIKDYATGISTSFEHLKEHKVLGSGKEKNEKWLKGQKILKFISTCEIGTCVRLDKEPFVVVDLMDDYMVMVSERTLSMHTFEYHTLFYLSKKITVMRRKYKKEDADLLYIKCKLVQK